MNETAIAHLKTLLDTVVAEGASDIHLSVGNNPMLRISGSLVPLLQHPILTSEQTETFLKSIAPAGRLEQFAVNQSMDFSYAHTKSARFRVNGYIVQGSVAIAMRLIPHEIRTFESLNLPPILEVFSQRSQGFFLVVGPVGQGKSTTLATIIDRINETRSEHIVTIEDPIEYIFEQKKSLIHQREVHIDTPDFHSALNAAFREDVNVIMVGEMRNQETISSAVTAAETGHLVLSTLHTNNAAQTIDVLSTCSHRTSRIRCGCSSQAHSRVSSVSVSYHASQEDSFPHTSFLLITVLLRTLFVKGARTR